MANTFAFQCKNCGAVEPAEAAGDNALPSACHICRHGVKYALNEDGTGFTVTLDPSNWIVLADLSPEELATGFDKHGLTAENIVRHAGKGSPPPGGAHIVAAAETIGSQDKA
jgi:hypothetical protein